MTTMQHRYPAVGETWTFQSCLKHGCPSSFPYDWKKFPLCVAFEVTKIEEFYAELVECGCFEFGKTAPRLHDPSKRTAP